MSLAPWLDAHEWMQVREWLYSDDDTQRELGVRVVCGLWQSRGRVPLGAQCTAQLIHLHLTPPSLTTRLALAMAVVRTINGLSDALQPGGQARDIRSVLGAWAACAIDVRHQATHGVLPEWTVLRRASLDLIEGLRQCYWWCNQPTPCDDDNPNNNNNSNSNNNNNNEEDDAWWDGRASSLRDEWSSWDDGRVKSALRGVRGDRITEQALLRAKQVSNVRVLYIVVCDCVYIDVGRFGASGHGD
jgi:hypothetical protein